MEMILNQTGMSHLLQSFYAIAGVRVGIFDPLGKEILAYPMEHSEYCRLIRAAQKGLDACKKCDRAAYQYAVQHSGHYIYRCHAGLTEMIAPIITSRDERIGFLMMGQMQQPGDAEEKQWDTVYAKIKNIYFDGQQLKAAYSRQPAIKMETIKAGAYILQALASYVWQDNYIRVQDEPLSSRAEKYITANLKKALTLEGIAMSLRVGKTTLCTRLKKESGITVNELVRHIRVEQAKQFLQETRDPIYEIAENVGIPDYNYFTKVFKDETGVTPSVFRTLCETELLLNR
jgi:AraC-like DNA-binding protein